jgi:hypothetical protein
VIWQSVSDKDIKKSWIRIVVFGVTDFMFRITTRKICSSFSFSCIYALAPEQFMFSAWHKFLDIQTSKLYTSNTEPAQKRPNIQKLPQKHKNTKAHKNEYHGVSFS